MEDINCTEVTGISSDSLNDALENAISQSNKSESELEVIETLSINSKTSTNYQVKLRAKQKELCEDV